MFAAILLAVLPLAPTASMFGAPCVCFEIKHAGARAVPENPFERKGLDAQQLMQQCMRAVAGTDDVFVRAEALRTTLRALAQHAEKDGEGVAGARIAMFDKLTANLKTETLLAPLSRATFEISGDFDPARKRLEALSGVARVQRAQTKPEISVWFDAAKVSAKSMQEAAAAISAPSIEPPTNRPLALATITLAFAGQSSTQLGSRVEFDPRAMARQAVELAPTDARVAILAAMVWFDEDTATTARLLRTALRSTVRDEYAAKNMMGIFGHFFGAETIEELSTKVDLKIARG